MADQSLEMSILDMADEFIAVANRMLEEEGKDLGHISTAIRYAAARFSAPSNGTASPPNSAASCSARSM